MSRYRRVWVVYRKELVETLRDKRTLAAMVLVPIVLYPVLMIIIVQALRAETGRRQAERYSVCVPDEVHRDWLRGVLRREDAEYESGVRAEKPGPARSPADMSPSEMLRARLRADQVEITVLDPDSSLWDAVRDQRFHVGLIVEPPPNPKRPADRRNRSVQILYSETSPRSEYVFGQLNNILAHEADRIVRARVSKMPDGVATLTPFLTNHLSTSSSEQQFAKILAMVVPFLLVIMTVTGALYPSIDLTAGERERGTLETLAVSPVPVGQIVAGKFGVIVTIAMFSTALNLGSMTAMFHFSRLGELAASFRPVPAGEPAATQAAPDSATQDAGVGLTQRDYLRERMRLEQEAGQKAGFITKAAPIVLLAMLPFAVLAGGVMLATCSFARTFKEAQNYMMPVMMAFMIPAMVVSYMPTTRLEGVLLVIPVANIVILIRELFLGNYQPAAMGICLLSTCFYAAVAVTVAARLYGNESVLFADVGSYKTLFARRYIRPQEAPSPAAALSVVALLFPFYFYWQSYLINFAASPERIRLIVAMGQIFVLALPCLVFAWYLKLNVRETFALRWPAALPALAVLLIAAGIVPVGNLLRAVQFQWFPPGPDMLGEEAGKLIEGSLASVLLALAIAPGICEELVFRGFLLSGLRRRVSAVASVVIVGLIFGLFHLYMEKIPVHSVLGAILALVCLRCGSIIPAMVVHIANNAIPLLATRYEALGSFFALPASADELVTPRLDARGLAFIGVFLVGLVMLCLPRKRRA